MNVKSQKMSDVKNSFELRFHQKYAVEKNLEIMERGEPYSEGLMGQLPRMGKSHIILGTILEFSKRYPLCNFLILSTAPNDSLPPLIDDLQKYEDFKDFFYHWIDKDEDFSEKLKEKNIFLASKQFLQFRIDDENMLDLPTFDIIFTDEIHNGGCTERSNDIFKMYGSKSHKFYVSGTYGTALDYYHIPKENLNLFDLESIALCKKIDEKDSQLELIVKHGPIMEKLIETEDLSVVKDFFQRLPNLVIHSVNLTEDMIENIHEINTLQSSKYGLSIKALFELNEDKSGFENEEKLAKLCDGIFYLDSNDKIRNNQILKPSILHNIAKYNYTVNERGFCKEYPLIMMCFLPFGRGQRIMDVSRLFKKMFEDNHINDELDILILNESEKTSDDSSLEKINKRYKSIVGKKRGLIVLSGKKCMMGISIPRCDVVLMMNNWNELNPVFQSMYRCMTEDYNTTEPKYIKKFGHVVDINFHRQINLIVEYSSNTFSGISTKEAIQKTFDLNLFNIHQESWYNTVFNEDELDVDTLTNKMYETWVKNADEHKIRNIVEDRFIQDLKLDESTISFLNGMDFTTSSTLSVPETQLELHHDHSDITKGYKCKEEDKKKSGSSKTPSELDEEAFREETLQKFKEMLNQIVFLCILLTIQDKSSNHIVKMLSFIQDHRGLRQLFTQKMKDWYHTKQEKMIIRNLTRMIQTYFPPEHIFHKNIERIKEQFVVNIKEPTNLHRMIQKYISSIEMEVKNYGNVSTPHDLVSEMVDRIPNAFWSTPKKILDPCCGKGTFLLQVIDKCMKYMNVPVKTDNEKYQYIIENCIYYSDLDPLNVYICNILLGKNESSYDLHFYCGDSLSKEFSFDESFDLVCMNPPFRDALHAKGKGTKIWNKFIEKSLNTWLKDEGYLLTLHPSEWRNIDGLMSQELKEKQMIYLKIFNEKEGKQIFGCSVRFDYYLLKNVENESPTHICDEERKDILLRINYVYFIPNFQIAKIYSMIAKKDEKRLEIIYDRSLYGTDKKNMINKEDEDFQYPCVYSIKVSDEPKFYYSNEKKGHFGISKLIFASGATGFLIDKKGDYGMTQYAKAIVDKPQNLEVLHSYMKSPTFKKIQESLAITVSEINFRVLQLFRHDFWKV